MLFGRRDENNSNDSETKDPYSLTWKRRNIRLPLNRTVLHPWLYHAGRCRKQRCRQGAPFVELGNVAKFSRPRRVGEGRSSWRKGGGVGGRVEELGEGWSGWRKGGGVGGRVEGGEEGWRGWRKGWSGWEKGWRVEGGGARPAGEGILTGEGGRRRQLRTLACVWGGCQGLVRVCLCLHVHRER